MPFNQHFYFYNSRGDKVDVRAANEEDARIDAMYKLHGNPPHCLGIAMWSQGAGLILRSAADVQSDEDAAAALAELHREREQHHRKVPRTHPGQA
jgi:hypothetical protein